MENPRERKRSWSEMETPRGGSKMKFCRSLVKRKRSLLAKASPYVICYQVDSNGKEGRLYVPNIANKYN